MIKHYCPLEKKWKKSKLFQARCECGTLFKTMLEVKRC